MLLSPSFRPIWGNRLGRRVLTTYHDQSTESEHYDFLGRMDSKTDQAGKITQYGYDNVGRLTSVTQFLNGLPLVTSYGYDEVGNRISQTDANTHTTLYSYDKLGRRTLRTLPAGQTETYGYDPAGNLTSKTDFNGHTTVYQYDSMNRLAKKVADPFFSTGACLGGLCGATSIGFTYTATGRRLSMTDASGTTSYTYDDRDRLLTKTTPFGTLTYSYDDLYRLTSETIAEIMALPNWNTPPHLDNQLIRSSSEKKQVLAFHLEACAASATK